MTDLGKWFWIRQPEKFSVVRDGVSIVTEPHTDLWQRTYYGFRNDNAPVFQMRTGEKYFSFSVRTRFEPKRRFDQCGIAVYIDGENWLKASVEYENERFGRLGSVVTNGGYSDWATTDVPGVVREMYYRLSRRESDFLIECSENGRDWRQMRICRLVAADGEIPFGIYACSPEDSSFTAEFSEFALTDCKWNAHE